MTPSGPAGVRNRPVPSPGTASSGTADRLAKWAKKLRYGTYSPKGTRWTFSNVPTTRPLGPQATTRLRNAVGDTVSVTPATTVVRSWRATPAIVAAGRRPDERTVERDDVLGPQDELWRPAVVALLHDGRRGELGRVDGGRADLLLGEATPTAALYRGDRDPPDRCAAVGNERSGEADDDDEQDRRRAGGRAGDHAPVGRAIGCRIGGRPGRRRLEGCRLGGQRLGGQRLGGQR